MHSSLIQLYIDFNHKLCTLYFSLENLKLKKMTISRYVIRAWIDHVFHFHQSHLVWLNRNNDCVCGIFNKQNRLLSISCVWFCDLHTSSMSCIFFKTKCIVQKMLHQRELTALMKSFRTSIEFWLSLVLELAQSVHFSMQPLRVHAKWMNIHCKIKSDGRKKNIHTRRSKSVIHCSNHLRTISTN